MNNHILQHHQEALRAILTLLLVFTDCFFIRTHAQERAHDEKALTIYFRVSDSVIDPTYLGNARSLELLDSLVSVYENGIDSIACVSYASPEGPNPGNIILSQERADAVLAYLASRWPGVTFGPVTAHSGGSDYAGLTDRVLADENIPDKDEVVDLLGQVEVNAPKAMYLIKRLHNRVPYSYIRDNHLPWLRRVKLIIYHSAVTHSPSEEVQEQEDSTVTDIPVVSPETVDVPVVEPVQVPASGKIKKTYFTVKTNLLYDAVTALNVEVEVPVAGRWSVMVEDVFPWWNIGNKYAFQMWEMGAEGRFWFKRWDTNGTKKMRGWFLGAYGMSSKYDFQLDKSLNYQGEYWSAGLSGGYVMPIGKKKRLNLEFSFSVGYLQTDFRHYLPTDDYLKLIRDRYNVGTVSYFGPTKAKISLVVPINFNKKEARYE